MTVVVFNPETSEHETIKNVWKIESIKNHIYFADGIKIYYTENCERKGLRVSNAYVTSITTD